MRAAEQIISVLGGASKSTFYPTLANNNLIVVSDSRFASSSDTATLSAVNQNSSGGGMGWILAAAGFAPNWVGNFGVNTDTIQGMNTRRTLQGVATGVSPTWRAEYDLNAPGSTAGVCLFLGGVNNTSETVGTFGPRYDTIFMGEIDAGRVVVAFNELPNNNDNGWGANNLARRDYLDAWPNSSTGMTAQQKATYALKYFVLNTYDAIASTPRALTSQAGTYLDNLHPAARGWRIIGDYAGPILATLFAKSGFAARNALPAVGLTGATQSVFGQVFTDCTSTSAITATNGESAGTGGANMDGAGGVGLSGVVIKDVNGNLMTITRSTALQTALNGTQDGSSQLDITTSIVSVNGRNNLRLTLNSNGVALPATGSLQVTVDFQRNMSQAQAQALSLNSQNLCGLARIAFPANQAALQSCGVLMNVNRPSFTPGQYFMLDAGANVHGDLSNSNAFDRNIMTTNLALPANFDGTAGTYVFDAKVRILLTNAVAINATIDIGALGIYPNR